MRAKLWMTLLTVSALSIGGCGGDDSDELFPADGDETSAADVERETGEALAAAGEYTEAQVAEFRSTMEERLDAADERIDALRTRMDEVGADARADLEETIAELEEQRDALENRLREIGESSERAWADVRSGLRSAWSELDSAIDTAASRFGGDSAGA
jgi:predicted  nucleic acid-binding Zn-ribbon protein